MYAALVIIAVKSLAFLRKANRKASSSRGRVYLCLGLVAVTSLMSACQPEFSLWVVPDSRASLLVIGFSKSRNGDDQLKVESISIFSCELVRGDQAGSHYPNPEYAVWHATSSDAVPTNRLPYGKDDFGLRTTRGPESLKSPGCYVVLAYAKDDQGYMGSARLGFKVQNDGRVIEMSNNEYKGLFTR